MRWNRLVAIPVRTALVLSVLTTLAPAAPAALATTAVPESLTTSSTGSDNAATAPAPPQPAGPVGSVDELEAQMLSMINAERAAAGVGAVQQIAWAHSVAQQHSQDMAAAGDIWHNVAGFIDQGRAAMGATYLGENVAMDSTLAANDALLYSDIPHRNVTLDGRFNNVGLGIALDSKNWVYVTEDFAQIPGGPSQRTALAVTRPVATQPAPVAKPPVVKAPVVKAPVAKAPVAVAMTKPAPIKAPVVAAAPAPAAATTVAAKPAPAPAVAAPAAPPAQPVQAISAKPVSHSSHPSSVWIPVGLAALLVAAFSIRRFVSIRRQARRQRPVATARSLGNSTSSSPWRRAA
ncbi:MAG: hypothetical protein QOD62_2556 [Actinomycetota bacterium]|nr:hypothetical protein [Actinomycetota bacterium]